MLKKLIKKGEKLRELLKIKTKVIIICVTVKLRVKTYFSKSINF
jgi:hypothetical protein